ncbi:hypothetical protein B566_EDAN014268, partial [Ephemera danica]
EDVAEHFVKHVGKIALEVRKIYSKYDPIKPLSDFQKESHKEATTCYLCKKEFTNKNYKVRDHDHLSGEYRGPACNICNLNNRKPRILPIFFHSLSSYDAHIICKKLSVVPEFPKDKLQYVTRKGVFCYDYVTSLNKLEVTKLPTKDEFYSLLNEGHISDADYKHAEEMWKLFDCKNLGDYIMYEFLYDNIKQRYGDNVNLLYMDTDSYILEIFCENFYKDLAGMLKGFDTSDYPENHFCHSNINKKVLAKFKD